MRRKSWIFDHETLPWPNAFLSIPSAPSHSAETPSYKQEAEKREVTLLGCVDWTSLTPGLCVSSYDGKGDGNGWLLGCSKSEGCKYCLTFLEGRSGWLRSTKKEGDKKVFLGSNFVQILPQEKRWVFSWGLCQKSRGYTQRSFLQWSDSSCTQGSRICVLFYKCAWIHCWSLLVTSSEVLYFGWLFYITNFAHSLWMFHWRRVRVSKKTIDSLFSLGPEAWDAGPLWGAPAVPKSTAYTWEKVLILHEAQSLSEA